MRNVASVLGVVVTAVLAGCGGKSDPPTEQNAQRGTLKADGTTTPAEHWRNDDGCRATEWWEYDLDASMTCGCGTLVAPSHPRSDCPAIEGRRPDGLRAHEGDAYRSLADYFANAAHLEAAAVLAFERLAVELRAHGAPPELLARVAQAEKEERRHVVLASGLARRFGGEPPPAVADSTSRRTLFAIARENVIEGVVRETFGAAIAIHRARRAADAEVRETLAVIAADECRHAELSWDLHEWMTDRLTAEERAAIEGARLDALRELGETLAAAEPAPELALLAGVPTRRDALRLFDAVAAVLWRAAA